MIDGLGLAPLALMVVLIGAAAWIALRSLR
jgi:hypothetical protein